MGKVYNGTKTNSESEADKRDGKESDKDSTPPILAISLQQFDDLLMAEINMQGLDMSLTTKSRAGNSNLKTANVASASNVLTAIATKWIKAGLLLDVAPTKAKLTATKDPGYNRFASVNTVRGCWFCQ